MKGVGGWRRKMDITSPLTKKKKKKRKGKWRWDTAALIKIKLFTVYLLLWTCTPLKNIQIFFHRLSSSEEEVQFIVHFDLSPPPSENPWLWSSGADALPLALPGVEEGVGFHPRLQGLGVLPLSFPFCPLCLPCHLQGNVHMVRSC